MDSQIIMMKRVASMMSGGLFNVKLTGSGVVAITSHYDPVVLKVGAATGPVFTDPDATARSGGLAPDSTGLLASSRWSTALHFGFLQKVQ